jgi:hypothetical protein
LQNTAHFCQISAKESSLQSPVYDKTFPPFENNIVSGYGYGIGQNQQWSRHCRLMRRRGNHVPNPCLNSPTCRMRKIASVGHKSSHPNKDTQHRSFQQPAATPNKVVPYFVRVVTSPWCMLWLPLRSRR